MTPYALDYDVIGAAISAALAQATGLPPEQIVGAQPEEADAPAPVQPYITVQVTDTFSKFGRDWADTSYSDDGSFVTQGMRSLSVSFNAFADTGEEAEGLMATWAAYMQQPAAQAIFQSANIAFWQVEDVRDLTEKYDTAWQPRIYMQATFGATASLCYDFDSIDKATAPDGSLIVPVAPAAAPTGTTSGGGASTFTMPVGESGASLGTVVSSGAYALVVSDATSSVTVPCIGIVIGVDAQGMATVQTDGILPAGTLANLQVGKVYFLGINGQPMVPPLNTLPYIQALGTAVSDSQLALHIASTPTLRYVG